MVPRAAAATRDGTTAALDLNGVTLPGAPLLVAGSNGHIAWGFTNSYGNWLDVERVSARAVGRAAACTRPPGSVPLSVVRETIRVHGAARGGAGRALRAPRACCCAPTRRQHDCWFGSLARAAAGGDQPQPHGARACRPRWRRRCDSRPRSAFRTRTSSSAIAQGHIGWTIFGAHPRGHRSASARARAGAWTTAADHPRIVDPPRGRLWTANARVGDERAPARSSSAADAAASARSTISARAPARSAMTCSRSPATSSPADMLRIQLDDRALFLARWRALLLSLLDAASLRCVIRGAPSSGAWWRAGRRARASIRSATAWCAPTMTARSRRSGRCCSRALAAADGGCGAARAVRGPAVAAGDARSRCTCWRSAYAELAGVSARAGRCHHRRSRAELPARWRAAPGARATWCASATRCRARCRASRAASTCRPLQLPGDHDMPRVQDGAFGASERFAVSPGHERDGYLELPGGQSGHPLSPYYRVGFLAWARGEPLPFLPGPAEHTLTLTPQLSRLRPASVVAAAGVRRVARPRHTASRAGGFHNSRR